MQEVELGLSSTDECVVVFCKLKHVHWKRVGKNSEVSKPARGNSRIRTMLFLENKKWILGIVSTYILVRTQQVRPKRDINA